MRRAFVLLACVLLVGCTTRESSERADTTAVAGDTVLAPGDSVAPSGPAATRLAGWRFEHGAEGERVTLSFSLADGTPARPSGPIASRVVGELGVLRLTLPSGVTETAVTDTVLTAGAVPRAYVVRSLSGGGLYVDLHADAAIAASMAAGAPHEWAVLVRAVTGEWPAPPAVDRRVVVLRPRPNAAVGADRVAIEGYARTFESNVVAKLTAGGAVADTFTTAADWSSTWGEFRMSLPPSRGAGQLFVGEYSAQDGSPQGVTIPIRGR